MTQLKTKECPSNRRMKWARVDFETLELDLTNEIFDEVWECIDYRELSARLNMSKIDWKIHPLDTFRIAVCICLLWVVEFINPWPNN